MNMQRVIAEWNTKDWPGPVQMMSKDAAAEIEWQTKIMGGYKKRWSTCKICFCKITPSGSCNCK